MMTTTIEQVEEQQKKLNQMTDTNQKLREAFSGALVKYVDNHERAIVAQYFS